MKQNSFWQGRCIIYLSFKKTDLTGQNKHYFFSMFDQQKKTINKTNDFSNFLSGRKGRIFEPIICIFQLNTTNLI
jgi:glutathione peroxidase-family protein